MATRAPKSGIRVKIHERGDRRLDGILRLIEEAGRPRPLADVLRSLCEAVSEIARVEVVSVYVADGDDLVIRANVGFAAEAVGNVRLKFGEGLTGVAAECLRPVSVAVARHDERYKHVPGIGEEHFPSYLGIPLLGGGTAVGVMVLQRRQVKEFPPAEVALAMALAAPIAYAIERAAAREKERTDEREQRSAPGATARTARLPGVALGGGVALGRAEVLPSLDGATARLAGRASHDPPGHAVALALASLARELGRARLKLEPSLDRDSLRRLRALALLLEDERFRDLVVTKCGELGVAGGLATVAREYARAPYRVPQGDVESAGWLTERAAEVEDLCMLIGARAAGEDLPRIGVIIVTERLTAMVALAAAARRAVAVAVAGPSGENGLGAAVARAAGMPVVAEVGGLFAWVRPDDRMLVDGDAGLVRVNPPATAVARFRANKV